MPREETKRYGIDRTSSDGAEGGSPVLISSIPITAVCNGAKARDVLLDIILKFISLCFFFPTLQSIATESCCPPQFQGHCYDCLT